MLDTVDTAGKIDVGRSYVHLVDVMLILSIVGDSHPCTIIQTIDHRPFFVPCFAQNVHPLHDNLNDVWGNFYNGQDFIFTQDTTALFKNWSKLTQESYSSLNMNGVMECQLIDRTINFHSSQGSQEESVTQQYWKNVSLGSRHLGSDPCIATRLPELMIQAGFVDVQVKWRRLPIGDWPTNLKQKTLGLIWRRILVKEMEGAVLKPLIDGLGWSREDVDKAAEDTYRALLACNNISRPYMTAWSVYGRRGIPHTLSSPLQGPESRACSTSPFSLPWLISRFVQRQLQVHEQPRARRRKRKANSRISTKPAKRHRSLGTLAGGMSAPSSRGHARGNTPAIQADDGPPPVDAEQNRHAVERLLDRRIFRLRGRNQQVIRYRVRWEGYGLNDNEWVDEDDIDPPLIQAYEASTRSADGRVGNAMVEEEEEEEDERASDAAELVEDHRNQRSSRTQGRYQWEESDELLSSRAESGITKGQPTPGLVLWKLRPERGYERTAYE